MAKSKSPPPPADSWPARLRFALDEAWVEGRTQKGMDSSALAKAVNSANSTVSAWTTGRVEISVNKLIEVCRVLNIREEWLLHGRLPMRPAPDANGKILALSKLLSTCLQGGDTHRNFLETFGSDTLQFLIGKLAAVFSEQDIELLTRVIAARDSGTPTDIAMQIALTAFEQSAALDDKDILLINSAISAKKFGKAGSVAMDLALAAFAQLNYLPVPAAEQATDQRNLAA